MKLINPRKNLLKPQVLLAYIFLFSISLALIGFLNYKSIFNVAYGLTLLSSFLLVVTHRKEFSQLVCSREFLIIFLTCTLLPLSILLGQIFRSSWLANQFDGPIRLTLSIAVIFSIYLLRINFLRTLEILIPFSLIGIYLHALFNPGNNPLRLTNSYVDPIIWGNFCMVIGCMLLFSIAKSDHLLVKVIKGGFFIFGAYLSVLSQSRAGWLAGIALLITYLIISRKEMGHKKVFHFLLAFMIVTISLYILSPSIHGRVDEAILEVNNWMSGANKESSAGYRLTMWKMSLYLLAQAPWTGYGDHQLLPYLSDPYILSFADKESIKTIQCCGPHNEIMAHSLRSGIWGLFAILLTYLLPILFYLRIRNQLNNRFKPIAHIGLSFSLGLLICAFLSEMLSLKFIYSYYSLIQAGIIGTILWKIHE